MEEFIPEQESSFILIKKTGENFKKSPKVRLTRAYILTRIETVDQYWENFRATHYRILKLSTKELREEHQYFKEDWFAQGEEEYIEVKSVMREKLEELDSQRSPSLERLRAAQSNSSQSHQEVKLPQINIPRFSGNYSDWSTFRDLYKSLIHDNVSLSKVQKLHYLKSSLTGESEQLLKHIQITELNYDVAWDTLTKRYNNKRIIVNAILNRLVNQKKLSTMSAKGVKELLDTTTECMNNLQNNEVNTVNWDVLIIYLVVNKLDDETRKEWEEEMGDLPVHTLPNFLKFTKFLETSFRVLEMVQSTSVSAKTQFVKPKTFLTTSQNKQAQCAYCDDIHSIYQCQEFTKLEVDDRVKFVQTNRLCFNCLSSKHPVKSCQSKGTCTQCNKRHHTLLHFYHPRENETPITAQRETEKINTPVIRSHLTTQGQNALMATALINIKTGRGLHLVRALIDPCSQESFISKATVHKLQLRRTLVEGHVTGVDQMTTAIKFATELEIFSRVDANFQVPCTAFVVKHVTDILPTHEMSRDEWPHLQNLTLADPTYHKPGHVDMLLGVNIYTEMLMSGVIRGDPGSPIAQQTRLGWIISEGVLKTKKKGGIVSMHLNVSLDDKLQRFWETERFESDESDALTPLEVRAEEFYEKTVTREPSGRYIVALPFKKETPTIPENSKEIAIKRIRSLERKLATNEPVKESEKNERAVYLPHHAVVREDKETTKIRAVYDASCKGSKGSLNDQLLVGPPIQQELRDILLRWRMHKISFISDVIKMYRQILVRREDTDFQRIVWRSNTDEAIEEYRLLTVTFGLACSPYLAIKTLRQVARDEGERFPVAKEIINNDVYMDDILSGSHDVETALEAQRELTDMLKRGGFELQKWLSNSEKFMENIEPEKRANKSEVDLNRKETVKALGVTWNVRRDELQVTNNVDILPENEITKRTVLSEIASLFDPMGWLAPAIVMAKIFMQRLWKLGVSWDAELPDECRDEWIKYRSQIQDLSEINIPRWIGVSNDLERLELHGFADASTAAYASVVYGRAVHTTDEVTMSILMAKTRVAPVKQLTLPRLELCAALLLSKLMKHVARAMRVSPNNTYAWSDSQIALAWIKGDPMRWKTYVRNRVIEINNNIETTWLYINTRENPADPASRGVTPEKLKNLEIWWRGPSFLQEGEFLIPTCEETETELERREPVTCTTITEIEQPNETILTLLRRFSSLKKLINVVAYCRRWLHLKQRKEMRQNLPEFVTHEEREEALTVCIRISQKDEFGEDVLRLSTGKHLKKESRLISLNPFLDNKGVLRVGGRLKHAELEFLSKHPIILSKNNVLLSLLLHEAHRKTLHGGPQMMITYLRGKYWLINAGNTVKRFVRNCMRCAKQRNINRTQLMGNLPEFRVRPSRPFSTSGVDFAGPIQVRMSRGRGAKSYKAYIALFICMVTKAIHVELVSDMTTEAFLAAFRRFVSRRGPCTEMWSDNGTTFVSASKELLKTWKQGQSSIPDDLSVLLDSEGTKWKYIPPGAPNFGGLWEAGVKSVKYHLKRTVGDSTLTFEELSTLLIQIEACLNSRPLSPLSDHPGDFEPLTPSHFLIGEPLITASERDYTDVKTHSLNRWQTIQKMLQVFWRKWQIEYMSRLQQRPIWTNPKKEFTVGDLVLIKNTRYPPCKWLLGRILDKHPGQDGLTRTYDVRTATGVLTRAVSRLCPLPEI